MRKLLHRLDEASAKVERFTVLFLLTIMALTVFFDVVLRVAGGPEGIILNVLHWLAGQRGANADVPLAEGTEKTLRMLVPVIIGAFAWLFFYGAVRTPRRVRLPGTHRDEHGREIDNFEIRPPPPVGRSVAYAFGLLGLSVGLLLLAQWIFPNGLVWSQPLALSLLLWVALFGATLVTRTRGHIALEVAEKMWPKETLPFARLASGVVACVFCLTVTVLGIHYVEDPFTLWREQGVGYLPGIPIPRWVALAAIPVAFFIMGLRFLAYAIADHGKPHEPPPIVPPLSTSGPGEVRS